MEGKLSVDGRFIVPGALRWDESPIPVVMAGEYADIVGKAENLVRHPDGIITANITWNLLSDELKKDVNFSIYTTEIEYHLDSKNIMQFTSGLIRSIIVVDYWPWADEKE
jgi:hypothetical protein